MPASSGEFYMRFGEYEQNIGQQQRWGNGKIENAENWQTTFNRLPGEGLWDDANSRDAAGAVLQHVNHVTDNANVQLKQAANHQTSLGLGQELGAFTGAAISRLL
jgi:hypothetical protein